MSKITEYFLSCFHWNKMQVIALVSQAQKDVRAGQAKLEVYDKEIVKETMCSF